MTRLPEEIIIDIGKDCHKHKCHNGAEKTTHKSFYQYYADDDGGDEGCIVYQ